MGGDISDGAKIGIGLVLLVAIVAIVMALLKMVKNQTNSGSTKLQDSFDKVAESEFDGYDQVEKTGTDVIAAIKIFQDRPVAIVVQTAKDQGGTALGLADTRNSKKAYNYGALISGVDLAAATGNSGIGKIGQVTTAVTDDGADAAADATIANWKGHTGYIAELKVAADGSYEYNNNLSPLSAKSTTYYVRSSGRFMSELIKNDSGDNIGVYFYQTK